MTKNLVRRFATRPVAWVALTAAIAAVVVALALFQPWKLWVDQRVDEAPLVAASSPTVGSATQPSDSVTQSATGGPQMIAQGTFISHEHDTTGAAQVLQAADGSRYLRLENLDTSNGPLLKVWLTDAPVRPGTEGWYVFDDGRHVDLGALKGNKGSQNYPIPADVDTATYHSVSIWCARFHVSFGAAELTP